MKVLRVIARLNVGGPARHVALLNAGLQARGHQTLLVYGALDTGEASLESMAVESGIPLRREEHLGRAIDATSDVRAFLAILGTIFREQPDVIHTHTAKAGALGRAAALVYNATRRRRQRALVVHTFHGHVFEGYFSPAMNRLVRLGERWLARAADTIVTISPRQRDDIVHRFGVAADDRTVVVPLGLDLDSLLGLPEGADAGRAAFGFASDDIVVGFSGRMVPVKDLGTAMAAFGAAVTRQPRLRLLLAGDGPGRAMLEKQAATLGVADRVRFLGWVSDLPAFYRMLDVFLLSSLNEGTPVSAIEAMAAARPVVATAVGGVPDVVEHGRTGILVPAQDTGAMAGALVELAAAGDRRLALGREGRRRARERYSHLRLVDDVERLYRDGLASKRGR
ncbi:MAG: glycosyltransferase family 4 protein [Vicinamibacterales bacterium]